jgi:hypothetical protein
VTGLEPIVVGFLLLLALATLVRDLEHIVLLMAVLMLVLVAGRALWRRV